ncbi:MAG: selenium-dependent molybdenum cofactor biosynthesis protein YqeB [Candidatus Xenobia bacterium]
MTAVRILVWGGGDLATGVAWTLHRAGLFVAVLELPAPLAIRRAVSFASAVADGQMEVEGVEARRVEALPAAPPGYVPLLVDPEGVSLGQWKPDVVVDARMAKRNLGTSRQDAPLVIALGPGFVAGEDVHVVIETHRGHNLGRILTHGAASRDTGVPGEVGGESARRVLRAPCDGTFQPCRTLGDVVTAGDVVARVGKQAVLSAIDGRLRGLLAAGTRVCRGLKVGDVDPRAETDLHTISDKSRAIGGAVLLAILWHGPALASLATPQAGFSRPWSSGGSLSLQPGGGGGDQHAGGGGQAAAGPPE